MTELARYFLTVDWCKQGNRGIFCTDRGDPFPKDAGPHTEKEMYDILGPFFMVLAPQSELLTVTEAAEYRWWTPLEEYSNVYGIAAKMASPDLEVV